MGTIAPNPQRQEGLTTINLRTQWHDHNHAGIDRRLFACRAAIDPYARSAGRLKPSICAEEGFDIHSFAVEDDLVLIETIIQ